MHEGSVRGGPPHRKLRLPGPLIAKILGPGTLAQILIEPGVAVMASKNESVEAVDLRVRVERKAQLAGAVLFLEEQSQGVLRGDVRTPVDAPVNSDTAIDLDPLFSVRVDNFHRTGPLPARAAGTTVGIDTPDIRIGARVEQVIPIGDDGERGESEEVIGDLVPVSGIGHNILVHFIVSEDPSSPGSRKSSRASGLV